MQFKALGDWVVIKVDSVEERTAGGVILTDWHRDEFKPDTGVVLSAGAGKTADSGELIPMLTKTGQYVVFNGLIWDKRTIEGVGEIVICRDTDIHAVIEEAA